MKRTPDTPMCVTGHARRLVDALHFETDTVVPQRRVTGVSCPGSAGTGHRSGLGTGCCSRTEAGEFGLQQVQIEYEYTRGIRTERLRLVRRDVWFLGRGPAAGHAHTVPTLQEAPAWGGLAASAISAATGADRPAHQPTNTRPTDRLGHGGSLQCFAVLIRLWRMASRRLSMGGST